MDYRIGYRKPLSARSLAGKKRRLLGLATAVAAIGLAAAVAWSVDFGSARVAPAHSASAHANSAQPTRSEQGRATRLVYPFSIVPGGVGSREDIARSVASDKVVAAHYATFDVKSARLATVEKPRWTHVSYRKGDKVYWTAKKVLLSPGETLLTDGSHEIRGRCGNRISDAAQMPVSPDEPKLDEPKVLVGGYDEVPAWRPDSVPATEAPADAPARRAARPDGSFGISAPPLFLAQAFGPPTAGFEPGPVQPIPTPIDAPPAVVFPPSVVIPPNVAIPPSVAPPEGVIPPTVDIPPSVAPPSATPPGVSTPPEVAPPAPSEVPEPSSVALAGIAFAVMIGARRMGARPKKKA